MKKLSPQLLFAQFCLHLLHDHYFRPVYGQLLDLSAEFQLLDENYKNSIETYFWNQHKLADKWQRNSIAEWPSLKRISWVYTCILADNYMAQRHALEVP